MSGGVVTKRLISLIAKQVGDNGLVVWYDPNGAYAATLPALKLYTAHRLLRLYHESR